MLILQTDGNGIQQVDCIQDQDMFILINKLSYGLSNAPTAFSRTMNLSSVWWV